MVTGTASEVVLVKDSQKDTKTSNRDMVSTANSFAPGHGTFYPGLLKQSMQNSSLARLINMSRQNKMVTASSDMNLQLA